jgi:hypothetical protein
MAFAVVESLAIRVDDVSVEPNLLVAQGSLADQQNSLQEFGDISFVLPTGITFGAPVTLSLSVFKPKTVHIVSDQPFQMKIGAGADIHKVRNLFVATLSAGEPTQLLFATGTGVTVGANIRVILGSEHP